MDNKLHAISEVLGTVASTNYGPYNSIDEIGCKLGVW